jgi:hypothetical protein
MAARGELAGGLVYRTSLTYSETCYEHVDLVAAIFGYKGV